MYKHVCMFNIYRYAHGHMYVYTLCIYIYMCVCVCAWLNQSCGLVATTPSAIVCVAGRRQHLPENVGQLT